MHYITLDQLWFKIMRVVYMPGSHWTKSTSHLVWLVQFIAKYTDKYTLNLMKFMNSCCSPKNDLASKIFVRTSTGSFLSSAFPVEVLSRLRHPSSSTPYPYLFFSNGNGALRTELSLDHAILPFNPLSIFSCAKI